MKKYLQVVLAAALLMMFSVVAAYENDNRYITYESILEPVAGHSGNQMKRMAVMVAYQALAEEVSDIYVTSDTTVKNVCELDETINAKVQATLHGREIVSQFRDVEGNYHAIVRIPRNSLAGAVLPENVVVEDFPKPKVVNLVSVNYTGLIIDCRGKGLSQAIAPAIKSVDGTEVYAYKNLGYDTTVNRGMVDYSTSVDSGVERAGSSPLVIKAADVSGGCDVIVNANDADKILSANQSANFLNNCAVVLVR